MQPPYVSIDVIKPFFVLFFFKPLLLSITLQGTSPTAGKCLLIAIVYFPYSNRGLKKVLSTIITQKRSDLK